MEIFMNTVEKEAIYTLEGFPPAPLTSSQKGHIENLSLKLEIFKETVKKSWPSELKAFESAAYAKLGGTINSIFQIALQSPIIEPEYLVPYVESLISLEMVYAEKSRRSQRWVHRTVRVIFGNPTISNLAYSAGILGLAASGIAFGWSVYYNEGPGLIACLALGIISGVIGGVGGYTSNALGRYYDALKVTKQETRIQASFNAFLECYLIKDYQGCKEILDTAPDTLLLVHEVALRYLINKKISIEQGTVEGSTSLLESKSMTEYDLEESYASLADVVRRYLPVVRQQATGMTDEEIKGEFHRSNSPSIE